MLAVEGAVVASVSTSNSSPPSHKRDPFVADPTARLAQVGRLQADFTATRAEFDELMDKMKQDLVAYEAAKGPFMYQGRCLVETLGKGLNAPPAVAPTVISS